MKLHVARDPVVVLWEHNDRLERRMLELRRRGADARVVLPPEPLRCGNACCANLAALRKLRPDRARAQLAAASAYRDLLSRTVITPRIHQNMVTSADPFAIDTTGYNLTEINEIAGRYGNPGMVLALQVSMSTEPEALIALDRKLRARREEALRSRPRRRSRPSGWRRCSRGWSTCATCPHYLDKLWEYAVQSRRLSQSPNSGWRR
jgi:hypothetical protein